MSSHTRKEWTVSDKVNTVEHVDKGKAKVSRDLGVSESTLHGSFY